MRRSGFGLVLGNGAPVGFWAVNAGAAIAGLDQASVDYLAGRLAKTGASLVRFHSRPFAEDDVPALDPRKLEDLHYFVAALKRQGIYTKLSFDFPLWFDAHRGLGIRGEDPAKNTKPVRLAVLRIAGAADLAELRAGAADGEKPVHGTASRGGPGGAYPGADQRGQLLLLDVRAENVPGPTGKR